MRINEARELQEGDLVYFPEDLGAPEGMSQISYIAPNQPTQKSYLGTEFIWINLKKGGVWPSNRLRLITTVRGKRAAKRAIPKEHKDRSDHI